MAFPPSHREVAAPSSRWARQLLVDVHFRLGEGEGRGASVLDSLRWLRKRWAEAECSHIVATLSDTEWVVAGARGAAVRLGMNQSTLQFRMKKLGITRPKR
jgi:transcriptional regulator with GAF, ATPase, and Fis domain